MILRLGLNAATHMAAGAAVGVMGVLAACTVAQVARKAVEDGRARGPGGDPGPFDGPPHGAPGGPDAAAPDGPDEPPSVVAPRGPGDA